MAESSETASLNGGGSAVHPPPVLLTAMSTRMDMNVVLLLGVYCACSSLMLILNKLAVHHIAAPAFVTLVQFAVTTCAVVLAKALGWIEADGFEWSKVKHFIVYVLAFSGGTWSNMRVLMDSNVETVIVFRACAPLAVCVFDYIFHKRAMPNVRSLLAMLLILAGAINYVCNDRAFRVGGLGSYFWVLAWLTRSMSVCLDHLIMFASHAYTYRCSSGSRSSSSS